MEKAKISSYQLFVLILLFELGSALLFPLATETKQDAWIAVLLGMLGGFVLFVVYHGLYCFYPDMLPTEYTQKIIGKVLGRILSYLYILYFTYLAARVLRDFGELLVTFAYPDTPLFIINALLTLAVVYTIRKGIEVLARTGELLFVLMYLLASTGFILVVVSGLIDINNLKPVLEDGILPVLKAAMTQTLYVPFGEVIVFTMIMPYLNKSKKARMTGLFALGLSGINLAIVMAFNISVLGVDLTTLAAFPLLSTIQTIQVADFLERLDVYFMLALIIGGFFKISIYCYAAVTGTANLFNIKEPSRMVYPIGLVILTLSITMASNFSGHLQEGLQIVTLYLHLPFQVIIPIILLGIAIIKNRIRQKGR
ncbi:GerAB/ArcD/ProY family transporter [Metabacillus dongyingensis]|uniref:GerAB/ArcD/ProY family transporter n=1 Tax=Metabacillus dongyingensis TaxID=2874282 RepID=UPI001CBBBDB9|nr:GerAB/ArcD/ProY family transporter [Metabacillus dongyingensis]UAL51567.1 spore germination protein [Metabacillus dongyingensis]